MKTLLPEPARHVWQLLRMSRISSTTCNSIRQLHIGRILCGSHTPTNMHHCYVLLGVEETIDDAELKEAYLARAKEYHPDSGSKSADQSKFNKIQEAYRTIKAYRIDMEARMTGALSQAADGDCSVIKHKAPQHRQYLSNEGVGYGTPSQRQKQYQQHKVRRAEEAVTQRRISIIQSQFEDTQLVADKTSTRTVKGGIERIVEDLILESIAKGEFEDLAGSGKPLTSQDANPAIDTLTFNLNKIVINEGFAPQWIATSKEIRTDMTKARRSLQSARIKAGPEPWSAAAKQSWVSAKAHFTAVITEVNKKVDRLNRISPTMQQQQFRVDVGHEVQKIFNWYEEQVAAGRDPKLPNADQQRAHKDGAQRAPEEKNTTNGVWQNIKSLFSGF